jgi:hypothetical protein
MSPSPVVLTTHARTRLAERQLSEDWVRQTVQMPDSKRRGKNNGTTEFVRTFGPSTVTVISSMNKNSEWVVVSAWVDPPVSGTKDWRRKQRYLAYKNAGFLKKFWMLALKQLGLLSF